MKLSTKDMILIGLFAALMVVGAYLRIPNPIFPAVPITLQLFFSVLAGIFLGSKKGALSQVIYTVLGLVGVPVFTDAPGIGYVFNAKFGFILGFILCAYIVGFVVEKLGTINFKNLLIASFAGFVAIYLVGDLYMYFIMKVVNGNDISLLTINGWMISFMIKDLILIVMIALASVNLVPIVRKATV